MSNGQARSLLPKGLTSFVGRAALLADAEHLLRDARLVTLVGPGGVGKTRLAVEVARRYRDLHGTPVAVAHLADINVDGADAMVREVAGALGIIDQSSNDPLDVLIEHLGDSETLLVLDNCEHLLEPVGDLLAALLQEAPRLRVLATSRRYLEVSGEHVFQVPPLSLPADGEESDAMTLLLDRAAAAGRAITEDDDWDAVVQLTHWSGGLPLVLELVAVRLGGGMSPRTILERLAGGQLLTARGTRRVQPHHKTLQQVLDWSGDLCSAGERRLWARISVFSGGFDLGAVEAVCSGDGIAEHEVIDLLEGLVQQSLVTSTADGRYHQLQPLREYGQLRLAALGEEGAIREAHCGWFERLAAEAAVRWLGPDEIRWLSRIAREMPNFRAALHHCATEGRAETGLVMAINLVRVRVSYFYALLGEFCDWLERLLALTPPQPTLARIEGTAMLGFVRVCQGSQAHVKAQLDECHALVRQLGDPEIPTVIFLEGAYAQMTGDPEAIPLLRRTDEMLADAGPEYEGDRHMVKLIGAVAAGFVGDEETAVALSQDCLADAKAHDAEWAISWAVWTVGAAALRCGDPRRALSLFQEALKCQTTLGDRWGSLWGVEAVSWALAALARDPQPAAANQLVAAAELLGGATSLLEDTGVDIAGLTSFSLEREKAMSTVRQLLGEATFHEAFRRGAGLPVEQVFALALQPRDTAATLDGLSDRRRQVAILISRGWANKQIAAELHLSLSTVENHVRDILRALGVHNRTQVAAWVSEQLIKGSQVGTTT